MPFEDFYKAADQHAHRWRLCLLASIFLIAAYFGVPILVKWVFAPTPPAVIPPLTKSLRGKADALCMSLPKPEQFSLGGVSEEKFVDNAARVVYTYRTQRSFEEIMPQFLIWFDEQEWEQIFDESYERKGILGRVFNFRRGSRRISILYFDPQKSNNSNAEARFELVCTVENSKDGN
jgi:hypothetical protein